MTKQEKEAVKAFIDAGNEASSVLYDRAIDASHYCPNTPTTARARRMMQEAANLIHDATWLIANATRKEVERPEDT